MSASVASSPTLIDSPHSFDHDYSTNHRQFRLFDNVPPIDFTNPRPPSYSDHELFSDEDEDSRFSARFRSRAFSDASNDPLLTPRPQSTVDGSMRIRLSSPIQQRPPAGLQLLYTHIAHGAVYDAVVERFSPPACQPETHMAIVDDVMSWIQYTPPLNSPSYPEEPSSPSTPIPMPTSATLAFYGPHARNNNRNRSLPSTIVVQPEHILWLTGPTSTGKSSLMQTVAERCSNTIIPSQSSEPQPLLAGTFFFRHNRDPRNNKSKFVTTIAYQLARSVPGLGELVGNAIEKDVGLLLLAEDEDRAAASSSARSSGIAFQMEKLVLEPLSHLLKERHQGYHATATTVYQRYPTLTPRVVLVDAVDECINDEDQIEILNLLRKLSQDKRFTSFFRLVVSSKPHRTIERQFKLHPDLDLTTYRLTLPFAAGSSEKARGGSRGRGRRALGNDDTTSNDDSEIEIRLYLQCKFNEICRRWYGLPKDVEWPDAGSDTSSREGVINRLVYNASGKFSYALAVIRFIMGGNDDSLSSRYWDPKRLLDLVLQAKFTKSYQNPFAALDALYATIIQEAAEKSGFKEASQLARAIREVDELLGVGTGIELTLPRLALFFGFDANTNGEEESDSRCLETAFTGGWLSSVLDVPAPDLPTVPHAHFKGGPSLRRVVTFHDKSFTDFIRDPSRSKNLFVSRSQLYTDLAVRYLRSASAQHQFKPVEGRASSSTTRSGKVVLSPASTTSSFSATYNEEEMDLPEMPFSAPAATTSFQRNSPYPSFQRRSQHHRRHTSAPVSPYAIDADDASLFLSQMHLGKFCSFSVSSDPELEKELMEFDVELWLFGIAASCDLESSNPAPAVVSQALPVPGGMMTARPGPHRRTVSEAITKKRSSMFEGGENEKEREKEREKKRTEALMKLHGTPHASSLSAGPESDIDAMYRWRRAIVKFWQKQGAPQQPTVMDKIYDKFMPRDTKRVKLITSRYRL
ncbi:hypothetical protein EST38_g3376 [Candolleomyces aberdarensis]|uniref:Nephrocystin 3-like N-terminal domain-containing protein n=1 Tax=Candolleomyces aberdarensis TaxID=2316362 RepID=A0A4V1Q4L2_9AGAR|nr:hypothetical protein EST38_g3376 [Candolleomyces aberdarensis]